MQNTDLIKELLNNNVNMILVGSYAANYYGYNVKSGSNDIDFIIDSSSKNLHNIYDILKRYNADLILEDLLKSYVIRSIIRETNEKIDMFRFSSKSPHINYDSLYEQNEYIIDYFYDITTKIISQNKLKEMIKLSESIKYNNIL
jgi:hypothetical protein